MVTGVKVGSTMRKGVITASKDDNIHKVAQVMRNAMIGGVVVTEKHKVIGILTEGDIIREVVADGKDPTKIKVIDIMKHPVRTIDPDIDVEEAMKIMRDLEIERLPVVSGKGRPIGIITERDMTRVEPALLEMMREKCNFEVISTESGTPIAGECESCGNYSQYLRSVEGRLLCEDCR